jgi:hypothetical protein
MEEIRHFLLVSLMLMLMLMLMLILFWRPASDPIHSVSENQNQNLKFRNSCRDDLLINPATCEYKDEGDDVQDYSSRGLKYNNMTTKIWRLSGEAVVDIEVFKEGRGMIHATVATNMLTPPPPPMLI